MLWYTPSLRTRVPSLSKTVGCIVLVLGVGRCAFRPPRVVFVLGLVSLINSLTSGKKISRLLRKGLSTPLFCACLPRRALALAAGAAAPRAPEATGPPAHRRGPYARCTALLAWTTHRRALRRVGPLFPPSIKASMCLRHAALAAFSQNRIRGPQDWLGCKPGRYGCSLACCPGRDGRNRAPSLNAPHDSPAWPTHGGRPLVSAFASHNVDDAECEVRDRRRRRRGQDLPAHLVHHQRLPRGALLA